VTRQTLLLPNFPDPKVAMVLSANGRAHHMAKHRAKQSVATFVVLHARKTDLQPMRGLVTLQPVWTFPEKRARDDDNLGTGVMKVCRDALVRDGFLEADDVEHLRQLPPEVHVIKGCRSLELRFEVAE
jgi:hypothetical protein